MHTVSKRWSRSQHLSCIIRSALTEERREAWSMKVFLSWSGETSKRVAIALNKWLPYILQPVRPWLSSEIAKGDRWGQVLETELKDAQYGIICLTKYNISKPWLNFESGVLSRFIERPCLTPLLFNID